MQSALAIPNSCFWELTRRCELKCLHCRSSSDETKREELDLKESLDLADQLVSLGAKFVILTGGEPTTYPGWEKIAKRLSDGGVKVRLFTNGFQFDREMLRSAQDAGVSRFSISLDGPKPVHDQQRPLCDPSGPSPFDRAVSAIDGVVKSGAKSRVVTQVNRLNVDHLSDIYEILVELGVERWQIHLCQMTGRAREYRNKLMCEPADLKKIIRVLLLAAREKKILAPLHCTVGYMTEEEPILRGREINGRMVWLGCEAGLRSLAITPTGGIKGCTTLPDEFITGSIKENSLIEIWRNNQNFPYTRNWSSEILDGPCLQCAFSKTCRAGCPTVAYSTTGSIGLNPYCLRVVRENRVS